MDGPRRQIPYQYSLASRLQDVRRCSCLGIDKVPDPSGDDNRMVPDLGSAWELARRSCIYNLLSHSIDRGVKVRAGGFIRISTVRQSSLPIPYRPT